MSVIVCLSACEVGSVGNAGCFSEPFRATVEGVVDGMLVKAEIFCDPTEHNTKEIYNVMTVAFSSPESLEGITVSLRSDNKATVRLKDTEEELPLYREIVEPYLVMMPSTEYSIVEKSESGFTLNYNGDDRHLIYKFDHDGNPESIEGEARGKKVSLKIIKFDQNQK
jgi:hypothetical protein